MRTKERIAAFDKYVAATETALAHPEVQRQLGSLATHLLQLTRHVYLPNVRWGRATTPLAYANDPEGIALLPASNSELDRPWRFQRLTSTLLETPGITQVFFDDIISPVSQVCVTLQEACEVDDSLEAGVHERPEFNPLATAALLAGASQITFSELDGRVTEIDSFGRQPILVMREENFNDADWCNVAATTVHELIHAVDATEAMPAYCTVRGHAASELVAYHASATLYDLTSQPNSNQAAARTIEAARLASVDPSQPYIPTDGLVKWMQHGGYL